MRASRIAAIRAFVPSQKETVYTGSSFEGQYLGQLGEKAVEKYFGVPGHLALATGGDGGVDVKVNGWRCQVRCRAFSGPNLKLIFKTKEMFFGPGSYPVPRGDAGDNRVSRVYWEI